MFLLDVFDDLLDSDTFLTGLALAACACFAYAVVIS